MKKKIKKIFLLSNIQAILVIIIGSILLAFGLGVFKDSFISYVSYLFSTYALIVFCIKIPKINHFINTVIKNKIEKINHHLFIYKYLAVEDIRSSINLNISLFISSFYSVTNFVMGLYSKSIWFIALAFYYISLTFIRYMIIKNYHKDSNYIESLNDSKMIRYLLFLLNITVTGIIVQIVINNRSFHYNGYLIYIVAIYSFYSIIKAIYNIIKYRNNKNSIIATSKVLALSVAIVSMFTLQSAMLNYFGNDFNKSTIFNTIFGGIVSISILVISVLSIIDIKKKIKRNKKRKKII